MSEELKVPEQSAEEFVRMLLWDEFPECCGSPVVGAEYMGQQEMICCGNPEPALLTDAKIVAALRERFPEGAAAASRDAEVQRLREALRDALSVASSVSVSRDRRIVREGCVLYAQTEEWCKWVEDEVAPKLRAALKESA